MNIEMEKIKIISTLSQDFYKNEFLSLHFDGKSAAGEIIWFGSHCLLSRWNRVNILLTSLLQKAIYQTNTHQT